LLEEFSKLPGSKFLEKVESPDQCGVERVLSEGRKIDQ